MHPGDTIVAVGSPPGPGAMAIIRVSGDRAHEVVSAMLLGGALFRTRGVVRIVLRVFVSGCVRQLDVPALAIVFCSPASFTGQDVVELLVPAQSELLDALLGQLLASSTTQGIVRLPTDRRAARRSSRR
jgi:tRNA modification GTPase